MKSLLLVVLSGVTLVGWGGPLLARYREPHRYPRPPARPHTSSWPKGLAEVIADKSYLDGYNFQNPGLVHDNVDTFFYDGGAKELNEFLARLAELPDLEVIVEFSKEKGTVDPHLRAGILKLGELISIGPKESGGTPCTWLMSVTAAEWVHRPAGKAGADTAQAHVVIFVGDGGIDIDRLQLPAWVR